MNPGISPSSPRHVIWTRGIHVLGSLLMGLALCVAWLPAAPADDLPAPPYSIRIDRLNQPMDSGSGVEFHAGQHVQYRVRAFDNTGKPTSCNPEGANQPQVLTHNPATGTVVQQAWGVGNKDGSSTVDVIMGATAGAAYLEVACGSSVRKVLLSNDGEPIPPSQAQDQSPSAEPPAAPADAGAGGQAGAALPDQSQASPPAADDAGAAASGGHALLIAGIVAATVVGVVAVAAAAASSTSSSGSTCNSGSHQCSPPNSNICCPDGTTIYCTNNNTCTNLTAANFGNVCGNGNASADGC